MRAKVIRRGGELVIVIPEDVAREEGLREGMEVFVYPARIDDQTLQQMVEQITPENRHEEVDFGPPVGKEVW
jgi:antitoxin MazE